MADDAPGVDKKVSDDRLLIELLLLDDNAVFASEVADSVDLGTQRARDRLNDLSESSPYVRLKKASGRNLYTITDEGKSHVAGVIRSHID